MRILAGLLGLVAVVAGPRAWATTADGTLLTNTATASFWSWDGTAMLGTVNATANVLVATPSLAMMKTGAPSMVCVGGTVTFCVWARNTSAASAFNVIIEDMLPGDIMGNTIQYVSGGRTEWVTGTAGATVEYGCKRYSGGFDYIQWAGAPAPADPTPAGQEAPYYLRWAVSVIGPGKSVMVCFRALVL